MQIFFIDIIYLQTAKIIWFLLKDRALVAKKNCWKALKLLKSPITHVKKGAPKLSLALGNFFQP